MHPALIKAALEMATPSASQATVAQDCAVTGAAVFGVIKGFARSARIERRIAEVTGLSLTELWPQHYGQPTEKRSKALAALRAALR